MNLSMERSTDTKKHSEFQQNLEYLRQIALFNGLDFECLKLLAMLSRRIDLIEGDQLMVQGEDDATCCFIINGGLQSYCHLDGEDYIIQSYQPGQFIGGLALLGKAIRLFTVQAVTESTVLKLNREGFQKVMNQFPGSMTKVGANLAADLTLWEQKSLAETDELAHDGGNRSLGISLL